MVENEIHEYFKIFSKRVVEGAWLCKCGGHGSYRVLRRAHVDERPVRFRAAHSHEVESCFILAAQV